MEISDDLVCLFSGTVREDNDSFYIEIPKQEVELGSIKPSETYQMAILLTQREPPSANATDPESTASAHPEPPVDVGDTKEVEIENMGDKGDGIARVDRGYVLVVPDTEVGEKVTVRIEETKQNFAFAEVLKHRHNLQNG